MSFVLLGILNAQAAGAAGAPGDYDLLETEILTGSQSSVTFSSLNSTYGADYQHLQIRAVVRTNRAIVGDVLYTTFNGTGGTSYNWHYLYGDGSSVASTGAGNDSEIEIFRIASSGTTGDVFGASVIDILDAFETTKFTTIRHLSGVASNQNEIHLGSGAFRSTNAIDSIGFTSIGDYVTGTRFSLYGLRSVAS